MENPKSRQASSGLVGEQMHLFDPPTFDPIFPNPATLAGKTLTLLLEKSSLTSPQFQEATKSWRLAAYVNSLKDDGWPIASIEIPFTEDRSRSIARYELPEWVKPEVAKLRTAEQRP